VEPPPPVEPVRGRPFEWAPNSRGIVLFAATQSTTFDITRLDSRIKSRWSGKNLIYNVCTETTEWERTLWKAADGPDALSEENIENLKRFLDNTAKLDSLVWLNIFCTLRDNKGWMDRNFEQYTRIIARIASKYDHVLLSVANEPYHPNSWFQHRVDRVRQVRDIAREVGFTGPMGADDNIGCPGCSVEYQYRSLGFDPVFHPHRNPDPSKRALRRLRDTNGYAIINEPTAYSSWLEGRCCTSDKNNIIRYMRNAEELGIIWFYHGTDNLSWPFGEIEWLPPL
jgi:hypothetical protein